MAVEVIALVFIDLVLVVSSFIAGLALSERFHREAEEDKRYALERQYVRLRA